MSRIPFPWEAGGPKSLRASLYAKLILPASVGAELGLGNDQVEALAKGLDVSFPTALLKSLFEPGAHPALPPNLDAAPAWRLEGDNSLVPDEA
jgi:hypothetical protein